jgi:hypothetical protein
MNWENAMTRRATKRVLLATVSTVVLAGSLGAGATWLAEAEIARTARHAGVAVGGVAVDVASGRVVLTDVQASLGGVGTLHIGRVAGTGGPALLTPAAAADAVSLSDLRIDAGSLVYRIAKIEVTGSSLDQAQLTALFDGKSAEPLAKRLAALSASRVSIPELTSEQRILDTTQTSTYRNIVLEDIVGGKIGKGTSEGGEFRTAGSGPGQMEGVFGPMTITDLDLALSARLYTDRAGPDDKELRPVQGSFSLERMMFKDKRGLNIGIGRIEGRDFRARPTATPWLEALRMAAEKKDLDAAPPAERARVVGAVLDIIEAFDIGSVEASDIIIENPNKEKPGKGRIAKIGYKGGAKPAMRVESVEISGADGQGRLGLLAFSGFSFAPTLKAVREAVASDDKPSDFSKFVPVLGNMSITDVVIDVANEKARDKNERITAGLKAMQFSAEQPLGGIPTASRTAVDNLTFAVPPSGGKAEFKDLVELGYSSLDLSMLLDQTWSEPANEYIIKEISLKGAGMGSAVLRGTLGNIGKDVFSGDPTLMQVALAGATVKKVALVIENNGLFERVVNREAKRQSRKPEDVRKQYALAATVGIPAVLGNSAAAKSVGSAVARFIAKPGRLTITAATKDGAGLGLADYLAAGGDPGEIVEKLDVTATAE